MKQRDGMSPTEATQREEGAMYVVAQHRFNNPAMAFARGERLISNDGAPPGVRGLQFYPSRDGAAATCLWESPSVEAVQGYVDSTLGDASQNTCYEVDSEHAFAVVPATISAGPAAARI
jgi:hypothetical protein